VALPIKHEGAGVFGVIVYANWLTSDAKDSGPPRANYDSVSKLMCKMEVAGI
jgi:hypothetical protein